MMSEDVKNECCYGLSKIGNGQTKIFPLTLCVVSTSDETIHCGICLTSQKNLHWTSGGGKFGPKIAFFGTILSLKIGFC